MVRGRALVKDQDQLFCTIRAGIGDTFLPGWMRHLRAVSSGSRG